MKDTINIIIEMARKALVGDVSLDEFYSNWPDGVDENVFFRKVYDDIESLIEHTPGDLNGNILYSEIPGLLESKFVKADLQILTQLYANIEGEKLLTMRRNILDNK